MARAVDRSRTVLCVDDNKALIDNMREVLEEAERVMLADHPLLPIYFYVNKHLVSPQVHGWYDNVMNVTYSKDLALGPAS